MATPVAFLSSTYLDNRDLRDAVTTTLEEQGFQVKCFERGGVFYDPNLPLDESCYREIPGCELMVVLIGGRYGSRASGDHNRGKKYKSVTRKELETATKAGIHVLVFVRKEVHVEYHTYTANPKPQRDHIKYRSIDDTQVFQLIEQVYQKGIGNPVFDFDGPSDLRVTLKAQLAGLLADALQLKRIQQARRSPRRTAPRTTLSRVNGLKLFYLRQTKKWSRARLAREAGLPRWLVARLEDVPRDTRTAPGPHLFKSATKNAITKLERVLGCEEGFLLAGLEDDFLSMYVQFYDLYRGEGLPLKDRPENHGALTPTKVLVLDFDGTVTVRSQDDLTTWERLWVAIGYSVNDCAELVRKYVKQGKVSPEDHRAWCAETSDRFRQRGFTREHLGQAAKGIKLLPGVHEVLHDLHTAGISLFLVSGSITDIIKEVLGPTYHLFDEVQANQLLFDAEGRLVNIRGTSFDFEGKAEFLRGIMKRQDVLPLEILFVGNSLNDVWASTAGVRTLCVNPHFTDPNDNRDWNHLIRSMEHFSEILPYLGRHDLVRKPL